MTVNDKHSKSGEVTSGVPQGPILSPCLFIALMSGINHTISRGTALNLFTDDILVFRPQFSDDDAGCIRTTWMLLVGVALVTS